MAGFGYDTRPGEGAPSGPFLQERQSDARLASAPDVRGRRVDARLIIALGGTGYAVTTMGTNQIRRGAVTTPKIKDGALTTPRIKNGSVTAGKLVANDVTARASRTR